MAGWSSASAKPWNGAAVLKSNPWASAAMRCAPTGTAWSMPVAAMRCAPTGTAWSMPAFWVLVRGPQGEFTPQASRSTGPSADPAQMREWFVLRWQREITSYQVRGRLFQEVRAHLGEDAQRQWPDRANARTTPILMGLFSWTTLAAYLLRQQLPAAHRTAPWYGKPLPAFVDASALVRRRMGLGSEGLSLSADDPDRRKVLDGLYHRLADLLAYAA